MEIFFKNLTPEEDTAEKLLQDLQTLREDTEELFRASGGKLVEESKEKFLTAFEKMKTTCQDITDKAATSAQSTGQTIGQYPFSAIGIAFGLGLLFGVIARRK
jgi:ElaB/YqjD/DUF883 family membrane-anchored ribosome-binding protein